MARKKPTSDPILSDYTGDPEMSELVEHFVREMPDRIRSLSKMWEQHRLDELRAMAHQLKGACGGYGFGPVSEAARILEDALAESADADKVRHAVDELTNLCRRVAA